ncbi:DUF5677 domain-containing protein [Hirschia maritima]|uniref:DUF5677 domain-containing protein n=1 Tax=Hirschia maritima TaxID=1121961 RepID=UPI000371478D|nr:DUF5677 domain-containing protein [Hirschia maritima]
MRNNSESQFKILEDILLEVISEAELANELSADTHEEQISDATNATINEAQSILIEELQSRACYKMLRRERKIIAGFEKRNLKRWKPAFDQIEILLYATRDIGGNFSTEFSDSTNSKDNYIFDALVQLHARGILVAAEAIHLLKGGFPDGAMTRWRTLHEVLVVSILLSQSSNEISYRYLVHQDISLFKAASQINKYADDANLQSFSDSEMRDIEERKTQVISELGSKMKDPFGWAAPIFTEKPNTWKANFLDLEEHVGLDHWRPRYKWASQHTHAGSRDFRSLLGLEESEKPLLLVGPSNSGFVNPLQMIALHLASLTSTLLLIRKNLDTVALSNALLAMARKVSSLAIKAEEETAKK